jgi:hypothetical protein
MTRRAISARPEDLSVLDMVRRMGLVRGMDVVDFNYPQHLHDLKPSTAGRRTLTLSNPVFKPPSASAIEAIYNELLSDVAFKFNLRCYSTVSAALRAANLSAGAVAVRFPAAVYGGG